MIRLKRLSGLIALAGLVASSAAAQQPSQPSSEGQTRDQSATPKKTPQPLDPADVATLTGRPVPREWNSAPRPANRIRWYSENPQQQEAQDNSLRPTDLDILTGKYDQKRQPYQPYGAEALWAYEWIEGRGYVRRDSSFHRRSFRTDGRFLFGPGSRLPHRRLHRPFFLPKNPAFFFLF
jgi:hypothetical protein